MMQARTPAAATIDSRSTPLCGNGYAMVADVAFSLFTVPRLPAHVVRALRRQRFIVFMVVYVLHVFSELLFQARATTPNGPFRIGER